MEIKIGLYQTFKLAWRYITYQFQQYRLTTSEHEVVNTSHGKVRGVKHKNAYDLESSFYAFEGVPYAKPPLGELRFRAPQPAEPWEGVLDCTKHKSKPNQVNALFGFNEGSEDCLYLNIYAKKDSSHWMIQTSTYPVMLGAVSTHMLMLSPQAKGLFHKAIMQSGSALCPWGCTDQHDWGYKLACHLGYDGANKDKDVYKFLVKQNAKRLTVSPRSLLTKPDLMINNLFCAFAPVIEPYLTESCITDRPYKELLSTAWGNEIPLIVGGNSAEGLFYYNFTMKFPYVMDDLNDVGCVHLLPDDVKQNKNSNELEKMCESLKLVYFDGETPNRSDHFNQYLELMGHRGFWFPIYRALRGRIAYASNVSTYCYVFDFYSQSCNIARSVLCSDASAMAVCHGDDNGYLFRNAVTEALSSTQREYKCIQRMVGMWYNFALTSNPNCKEISPTTWLPARDDDQNPLNCLIISDDVELKPLPFYEKLQAWTDFYSRESCI